MAPMTLFVLCDTVSGSTNESGTTYCKYNANLQTQNMADFGILGDISFFGQILPLL